VVVQGVGRIREPHPPAEHREVLLLLLCKESGGGEKKTKRNEESGESHGQDIMKPESLSARHSRERLPALGEFRSVRLDLPNGCRNVIDVAAVGQQQVLGHRHRRRAHLAVALEFLETVAVRLQPLGAEEALEPSAS